MEQSGTRLRKRSINLGQSCIRLGQSSPTLGEKVITGNGVYTKVKEKCSIWGNVERGLMWHIG